MTASASFSALSELEKTAKPLLLYHYASFLPLEIKGEWQNFNLLGGEIVSRAPTRRTVKNQLMSGLYNARGQYLGADFFPSPGRITFFGSYSGEEIRSGSEIFRLSGLGKLGSWRGRTFHLAPIYRRFYHQVKANYVEV